MRKLNLDILKNGLPGFSKTVGSFLAEAALVCLELNKHSTGVSLEISGDFEETFHVSWTGTITSSVKEGWKDVKEATEYGASALAILLIKELTPFQYFERMNQDEIGDYLIKTSKEAKDFSFIEISGIWKKSPKNSVNNRIRLKMKQIQKKATYKLELFTIVIEFSEPEGKIIRNEFG